MIFYNYEGKKLHAFTMKKKSRLKDMLSWVVYILVILLSTAVFFFVYKNRTKLSIPSLEIRARETLDVDGSLDDVIDKLRISDSWFDWHDGSVRLSGQVDDLNLEGDLFIEELLLPSGKKLEVQWIVSNYFVFQKYGQLEFVGKTSDYGSMRIDFSLSDISRGQKGARKTRVSVEMTYDGLSVINNVLLRFSSDIQDHFANSMSRLRSSLPLAL
eukprot:TRINITY_DN11859_c0_g1::TRINITY_DN11859_c0_g1_i1::g.16427::m.16427 TRINITY_DN11859_c0_g1::TRINITY_DN11859_c0_g1_i1::g.16427  ORF type:complete len:214 (+),score=12.92,UPF0697/PF15117.1/0.15 TRINITY_DN11859_c0_g1_i1:22-663(+)